MADVGDQVPSHDSPTTPFRKIVLPSEETVQIPRPPAQRLPAQQPPAQQPPAQQVPEQPPPASVLSSLPPIPDPPKRGIGDIPMKVVYLVAAIIGTVLAVFLIFMLFSGDVPANKKAAELGPSVAPAPASAGSAAPAPTGTVSPVALPAAPASRTYPTLSGTASVVIGIVSDKNTGISYPSLAAPWKAKSFPPFSMAQRIGKVAVPPTVIASAMFPGDSPAKKPAKDADYRALAVEAARWAITTQYPQGATLAWTASKKIPVGKGWTLGYRVTYPLSGKQQVAQAMVTVVEVGKTKPAMLLASIPEAHKKHWRDINTLVEQVRPL
ncbi:hypothetical protein [Nonomuraea sp. NPDC049695]|uniref:hypothetical protein n=1 Tax=Nonomuraea sp. NPDC049695 TaxID=3154734 RepID=UPI00342BFFF3